MTVYDWRMRQRGGTEAEILSSGDVPLEREIVVASDTGSFWIGDGVNPASALPQQGPAIETSDDLIRLPNGALVPAVDAGGRFSEGLIRTLRGHLNGLPAAGVAAEAAGAYSSSRHAYNFKASNTRRLRAGLAKAKAGVGVVRIGMCGDSTSAGYPSAATKSAPLQMRSFLESRGYPVNGTGPVVANPGGGPGGYLDDRYATTGSWTTQANNANNILASNQSGSSITFTSDRAGTIVEISYLDLGAGWTYSIDGAAAVAVPSGGGTGTLKRVTVNGLGSKTHTVRITVTDIPAGTSMYLSWVDVRMATSGVSVGNFGVNASTTTDWTNQTFYFPQMTLRDWAPDVVFVDLGINDWGSAASPQADPAEFKGRLQAIIDVFRGNADVILVTSNPFNGLDYQPYNVAKYELADDNDIPLVDVYEMFESWTVSNELGLFADSAHPSLAGYAEKGSALANAIL